ncbi:MAG: N-acetyltransferase [Candidatus Brocadiia bacterium]
MSRPEMPPSAPVEVRQVAGRAQRRAFLRLPWRLYRDDPLWVPPLLAAVDRTLDPRRNPFFEHGEARLLLAWSQGRPVGRIAAIVNRLHNDYHGDRVGFWGFFESERDPRVAQALFAAAAHCLRAHGLTEMRGPFNPSINDECGLLVEGFDHPPALLMPYNPPWYAELIAQAGLQPIKELYAYRLVDQDVASDRRTVQRLETLARGIRRRCPQLHVRQLDMASYARDVAALGELFNTVRRHNWGFVPVTEAELRAMARDMRPIVDPEIVLLAELEGRLVGCLLALPDLNPLLRKLDGRLLPLGWLRLLWGRRRARGLRLFGAGALPEHRNLGVVPLLFAQFIRNGLRRGYQTGELSWVAEDNVQSIRTIEHAVRPRLYKRYRIYARPVDR